MKSLESVLVPTTSTQPQAATKSQAISEKIQFTPNSPASQAEIKSSKKPTEPEIKSNQIQSQPMQPFAWSA